MDIAKTREELLKHSAEQLADKIINQRLNDFVGRYADYDQEENDPHGHGKRIPYIGWYWRNVDFATGYMPIGHCGDFIGFMENNKWGYKERRLTPAEVEQVTAIVCKAYAIDHGGGIVSDIIANTKAKLEELWPLLQEFPMEIDGWWIYGSFGQVAYAETEEEADLHIRAMSGPNIGGGPYRKVKA